MPARPARALVISGTIGSGKTTVAEAVSDIVTGPSHRWEEHLCARTDELAAEIEAIPADLVVENVSAPRETAARIAEAIGWAPPELRQRP